jgi:hypothetical protein
MLNGDWASDCEDNNVETGGLLTTEQETSPVIE